MTDTLNREREALAIRVEEASARLNDHVFQAVRAALNEAQIVAKGRALDDALDVFDGTQKDRREAETAERAARDQLEQAEVAARWEVAGKVTKQGNKILVPDDGEPREVTAAVRDEWIESQVRLAPGVVTARAELRKTEHRTAEAKDALERARFAIGIRRTQADLAGIHVQAIAGTLRSER